MTALIDHIGFLVPNLEEAMEKWSRATGYTFRAPSRYTVKDYRDLDNPEPHLSDVRLSMSVQGPPHIELMEPAGTGTHAATNGFGFHHLGWDVSDANIRFEDLKAMGLPPDGEAYDDQGTRLLYFMEKSAFYNVRLEFNQSGVIHPWFDEATGEHLLA